MLRPTSKPRCRPTTKATAPGGLLCRRPANHTNSRKPHSNISFPTSVHSIIQSLSPWQSSELASSSSSSSSSSSFGPSSSSSSSGPLASSSESDDCPDASPSSSSSSSFSSTERFFFFFFAFDVPLSAFSSSSELWATLDSP
eukprot:Selendium_serpulae@DN1809_c0_g1_i1.p1